MAIIIPNLGLKDLHDSELAEYAADKSAKINDEPLLAAVIPDTATVDAKNEEYVEALVAADDGTRADTDFKNDKRFELERLLTDQADNCVVIAAGNLALYERSGYKAKNTDGEPTGTLPKVTGLELDYGDDEGELKAGWDAIEDAQNFSVQVYGDVNNPSSSIIKEYIKPKIGRKLTVLDGLPSGPKVFVRVRANGGDTGHGAWSDVAEKRVP